MPPKQLVMSAKVKDLGVGPEDLFNTTMDAIGRITINQREIDIFEGHRENIKNLLAEFTQEKKMQFVGSGRYATKRDECILDAPHSAFWKASQTKDWKITPAGLGTFDNVFPETAAKVLRFKEDPDHWAYLAGIIEIGSSNNAVRAYLKDFNGDSFSRVTLTPTVRLGSFKLYSFNPGVELKDRATVDIDIEFETTADSEIMPVAVHILPQEIAAAANLAGYVEEA